MKTPHIGALLFLAIAAFTCDASAGPPEPQKSILLVDSSPDLIVPALEQFVSYKMAYPKAVWQEAETLLVETVVEAAPRLVAPMARQSFARITQMTRAPNGAS